MIPQRCRWPHNLCMQLILVGLRIFWIALLAILERQIGRDGGINGKQADW